MRLAVALCGAIWFIGVAAVTPLFSQDSGPPSGGPSSSRASAASTVLSAQVMLDRLGFSPGEIDGRAGANVRRAVSAFQRQQQLAETGRLDAPTLAALAARAGAEPPLVTYTLTDADVAGPFIPQVPADLMEQATLRALEYVNPIERLGELFHASPALLRRLNPGASFDRAGEQVLVPNVTPPDGAPARLAAIVYVTNTTGSLSVEDDTGALIFHAPVTSGSERDPLPVGRWKVNGVRKLPPFNYNPQLFWDADPGHAKAVIAPGPNNPVGAVWIDISKDHYGIHGTPEPSTVGHAQSHGCVRLTNWDALRVAQLVRPGTTVVFR